MIIQLKSASSYGEPMHHVPLAISRPKLQISHKKRVSVLVICDLVLGFKPFNILAVYILTLFIDTYR